MNLFMKGNRMTMRGIFAFTLFAVMECFAQTQPAFVVFPMPQPPGPCGHCVESKLVSIFKGGPNELLNTSPAQARTPMAKIGQLQVTDSNFLILSQISQNANYFDLIKTNVVCKGTVVYVLAEKFTKIEQEKNNQVTISTQFPRTSGSVDKMAPYIGICEGDLIPFDQYRKEGAQSVMMDELKKVQSLVSDDRVRTELKSNLASTLNDMKEDLLSETVARTLKALKEK